MMSVSRIHLTAAITVNLPFQNCNNMTINTDDTLWFDYYYYGYCLLVGYVAQTRPLACR